ncbi:hypothetical protein BH10ACT11_BH10ACT11_04540 [soil metagenome]
MLIAVAMAFPASASAGSGKFPASKARTITQFGAEPIDIEVGDFNEDGLEDIVAGNNFDDLVTVALGAGAGQFPQTGRRDLSVGAVPFAVAVGDLNNDTHDDLAIGRIPLSGPTLTMVRLGSGSGTFPSGGDLAGGMTPISVSIADVNNDSQLDLLTANANDTVSIRPGGGNGLFPNGSAMTVSAGDLPTDVAAGDFNNDGNADLAITNNDDDTVMTRIGAGDATFPVGTTFPTGDEPTEAQIGDFDADGNLDLAVVCDHEVDIRLGKGDGQFTLAQVLPIAPRAFTAAVADFNSDEKQDLAITSPQENATGRVEVRLGNGKGKFPASRASSITSRGADDLAIGDFDLDGNQDIAVVQSNDTLRIFRDSGPPADAGNLLQNGGAEPPKGKSAPIDYLDDPAPRGWSTGRGFTYHRYGLAYGYPSRLLSNTYAGLQGYFSSGVKNANRPSTATQTVGLAKRAGAIDDGRARVKLSAYLGGYRVANEKIGLTATFRSAGKKKLGSLRIPSVGAKARGYKTTLLRRVANARVPRKTRSVKVKLTATHKGGIYFDAAYADRVGLFLKTLPKRHR